MAVLGMLLLVGVILTALWTGAAYRTWEPQTGSADDSAPSPKAAALRYMRGVAIALVGGFWAGALVTGPAMRLIMRLLAATAGNEAQGRITEAEEVIGEISLDGTIGLYIFGGVLPGLLSGAIYVVVRRWLPRGRTGGVTFGLLHLVIAATRIDPLRPENVDFDVVGPGWLSVTTFALAAILHGMAVVAIANRYSVAFPPGTSGRPQRTRAALPLVLPVLLLIPGAFLVMFIALGLCVTVGGSQIRRLAHALQSRAALLVGRVALVAVTVVLLPGAVIDVHDVIDRETPVASPNKAQE